MSIRSVALSAALAAAVVGSSASAATVNATITADNHYALYTTGDVGITYVGGNELGAGGSPGQYNWSEAESYTFDTADYLYIAAWSDDSVAQGVLAQILVGSQSLNSGHPAWEVVATGMNRGDGDPHPSAAEIATVVFIADLVNAWETPFVGGTNGIAPWGTIAGIDSGAQWMWRNTPGDTDPLQGGSGAGEYLVFRIPVPEVPTPGSAALLGLGTLVGFRRRR